MPQPSHFHRPALAAAAAIVLAILLAACGSSSPDKQASRLDSAFKFSRCMREHGIKNFPDPQVSGNAVRLTVQTHPGEAGAPTPQRMDGAQRACRHFMAASEPKLTPQERAAHEEQLLKFATCMRKHGIQVRTSTGGGGTQVQVGGPNKPGPNPASPAFVAAQKACQGLLPEKGGGPGPSTSHSGGAGGPAPLGFSAGG